MDYEHDYYSDQCAGCRWAEWRGGCLNKAGASDGSDTLDSAEEGECAYFEAGAPQGRQPHPGERLSVVVPLDDYSSLRARAEAAEQRAEAAEAALAAARAEVAQARADRALLTGLWLATVPSDVLPALLPADPGDRDRLAAALDAVDLQASAESHTAAGRAVIARIVAEMAGGAR